MMDWFVNVMLLTLVFLLLCIVYRVLVQGGMKSVLSLDFLTGSRVSTNNGWKLKTKSVDEKKQMIIRIVILALGVRLLFYLIAIVVFQNSGIFDSGRTFANYLNGWRRWDAAHYINIATNGYAGALENGQPLFLVFFPVYPQVIRFLHSFMPGASYEVLALILSTTCYVIGCVYLYLLVEMDYGKEIAIYAVLALSLFPFSMFMGGIMTEGMFFLLSTVTFYYIRKHRWVMAGIIGAIACATRMMGLVLLVAGAVEWFVTYRPIHMLRKKKGKLLARVIAGRLAPLLLMFTGTLYYLLINYKVTGSLFAFQKYQKEHWQQGYRFLGDSLRFILENIKGGGLAGEQSIAIWNPDIVLFVFSIIVLLLSYRRIRAMYVSYYLIYLVLNYSVCMPYSCGRYLSCGVPLFIMLSVLLGKRKIGGILYLLISAVLLGIYANTYLSGGMVM